MDPILLPLLHATVQTSGRETPPSSDQRERNKRIDYERALGTRDAYIVNRDAGLKNFNDVEGRHAQGRVELYGDMEDSTTHELGIYAVGDADVALVKDESRTLSIPPKPFRRNISKIKIVSEKERSRRRRGLSMNAAYWTLDAGEVEVLAALSAVPFVYSATIHWIFTAWSLVIVVGMLGRTPLLSRSIQQYIRSALTSFVLSAAGSIIISVFSPRLLLLLSALSAAVAIFTIQNYDYYILGRRSPKTPGLSHWEIDMHKHDADCRYLDVRKQYLDLEHWQENVYQQLNRECRDGEVQRVYAATCASAERANRVLNIAENLYGQGEGQSTENNRKYWILGPGKMLQFLDSLDLAVEDLANECNMWLSHLKTQTERLDGLLSCA